MDSNLHVGMIVLITYLGQEVALTVTQLNWSGSAGRAWAKDASGNDYAAYVHTLNYAPPDFAWERISLRWRVC